MLLAGTDLIEIARVEKSLRSPAFLRRVFGAQELEELAARGMPARSAAACFAAKEAFSKAVGTGIFAFPLSQVQLLHKESGQPYLQLCGNAARLAGGARFAVSISHTDTLALAFVVAQLAD